MLAVIPSVSLVVPAVWQGFENSFGKVMNYVFSQVPAEVINAIEPILDDLNTGFGYGAAPYRHFPPVSLKPSIFREYGQEIQGMATLFQQQGYGQNITVGRLVLMNLIYEISAFCTSIVAQNSNGACFPEGLNAPLADGCCPLS